MHVCVHVYMSRSPRAARTADDAPPTDWLAELHLRILEGVDDFSDCAAFSLASPRLGLLGLLALPDPTFHWSQKGSESEKTQ